MQNPPIAQNLLALRRQKGVTQEAVARSLSISNKTLSKWENGASTPDIPMLIALAKYYGVTTDALLGLCEAKTQDTEDAVAVLIEGLGHHAGVVKVFDILHATIPATFAILANAQKPNDIANPFPKEDPTYSRSQIATQNLYEFIGRNKSANVAVTLLRNEENFAWLRDTEAQEKIAKLFRFLSDTSALSVLYFIHSTACSESFTADHVARNTGVAVAHVAEILDEFCTVGACKQATAHLAEGKVQIYQSLGDGVILSMLTLAFEQMCGKWSYDYNLHLSAKMILGDR